MVNRRPSARKPRTRVDLSSTDAATAAAAAAKLSAAGSSAELGTQRSLSPKSVVLKTGAATLDPSSANASEAGDAAAGAGSAFIPAAVALRAAPAAAGSSPVDQSSSLQEQLAALALTNPYASSPQAIPVFGGAELAACLDPSAAAKCCWDPSTAANWADPASLPWPPGMDLRDVGLWVSAALRAGPPTTTGTPAWACRCLDVDTSLP